MKTNISPATASDAKAVASLIYQSGPANIEAVFCNEIGSLSSLEKQSFCLAFIQQALTQADGQFGYQNQYIVRQNDAAIACVSFWSCVLPESFKQATLSNLLTHFGAAKTAVIIKNSELLAGLLRRPNADQLSIGHLAVDAAYQRQGLATQLLAYCQQHARMLGKSGLILDLAADNHAAFKAYQAFGFSEVGRSDPDIAAQRAGMLPHIHMLKQLS